MQMPCAVVSIWGGGRTQLPQIIRTPIRSPISPWAEVHRQPPSHAHPSPTAARDERWLSYA